MVTEFKFTYRRIVRATACMAFATTIGSKRELDALEFGILRSGERVGAAKNTNDKYTYVLIPLILFYYPPHGDTFTLTRTKPHLRLY